MSREDCKRVNDANDLVRYVFDPKMCALASSDVNKDCGCCRPEKQEPKPCDQTEECKKSNGKCVKKSIFEQLSAAEPNKWRWDIDLCRKPGTDDQEPCGCAIREEPTPPPTEEPKPCEATEVCMKNGGFGNGRCMSREDCARVDDMNEFVAYVF